MTRSKGWLRHDLLPSVAVALVLFHLLRTHVVERYRVTSRSMEPALHGDPEHGDIVLVDRTAWRRDQPRAWDLVVVRNRDKPDENHLVKRLIAIGPGIVEIRQGDVFFGPGQVRPRLCKDPVTHRDMRMTHAEFVAGSPTEMFRADPERWSVGADGSIEVRPVESARSLREDLGTTAQDERLAASPPNRFLPGHLSIAQEVGVDFLDGRGERLRSGGTWPRDIGYEVDLVLEPGCEVVQFVLEYAEKYFSIAYDVSSGDGNFAQFGVPAEAFRGPARDPGPVRFEYGYLDGHFFFVVDGALVWRHPLELPNESRLVLRADDRFHNLLHLGVVGSAGARVERMRLFRDSHYDTDGNGRFQLEVGEVFVMGDNAHDSSDSRDRLAGQFRLDDLLGRPVAILGPTRRRWLPRYPVVSP